MLIKQKRVRSSKAFVAALKPGEKFHVGVDKLERFNEVLQKAGFTPQLKPGEQILPAPVFGPTSLFNSEGKNIVHKDLPMETAYTTITWRWTEWHGDERVERSDFRDRPYQRYPRSFVPPTALELSIYQGTNGTLAAFPLMTYASSSDEVITTAINLCLEMFGECQLFREDLSHVFKTNVVRLNWKILPSGQYPWTKLKEELRPVISQTKQGLQGFIYHRLELLDSKVPDFVAVGHGGFSGYLIFGFSKKNLFMVESIRYGNATYVFDKDWEQLTKLTKAEILGGQLQKDRIIHHKAWDNKINTYLN